MYKYIYSPSQRSTKRTCHLFQSQTSLEEPETTSLYTYVLSSRLRSSTTVNPTVRKPSLPLPTATNSRTLHNRLARSLARSHALTLKATRIFPEIGCQF